MRELAIGVLSLLLLACGDDGSAPADAGEPPQLDATVMLDTGVSDPDARVADIDTGIVNAPFSDEFDDSTTMSLWMLRHQVEGTAAQYTTLDIDTTTDGQLTIVPTTSGWFADFDGPLMFQLVEGNFRIEVQVTAGRTGDAAQAPTEQFNSAGLLARDPDHGPSAENWVMYNIGYQADSVATEGKTTVESVSNLTLINGPHVGRLRLCRIGAELVMLRWLEGETEWTETHRFTRDDFPQTLQVGLIVNGWNSGGNMPDTTRDPDLTATFDYARFADVSTEADCAAE